jgi:hypothetical protein
VALAAIGVAQDGAAAFFDLGTVFANAFLAGRALFTLRTVLALRAIFALGAVFAGTLVADPIFAGTLLIPRTIVALAIFPGAILAGALLIPRTIIARAIFAGPIGVPVGTVFAPAIALLAVLIVEITRAIIALAILARPLIAGPVITLTIFAGTVALPGRAFAALGFGLGIVQLGFGGGLIGGLGLGLGALIFEVDVEAGGELVANQEFGGGPVRLHGAQQAEVVFGVLQIVLRQDAVAGCRRVARQLLVLFEDVLGGAAHLDPFGAVGIEGPVGVLLLGLAPAASAAAVAPALALHSLEISHYSITAWTLPGALAACRGTA